MIGSMDPDDNQITFLAIIPSIQGAIKIAGDGGMRIMLDIPESEMYRALPIITMREGLLFVSVEGRNTEPMEILE